MLYMGEKPKRPRRTFVSTRRANGPALRYFRERRGWTLHELEEESGVSYTQISRIETGHTRNPRTGTLKALAETLDVDIDDLVIYDAPAGVFEEPGLTEENARRLEEKRREKEERDAGALGRRARRGSGRDSDGAGDRDL